MSVAQSFHNPMWLDLRVYLFIKVSLLLCVFFEGASLILAKMPHDKITNGMQQLCNVQITPLNKVQYNFFKSNLFFLEKFIQ